MKIGKVGLGHVGLCRSQSHSARPGTTWWAWTPPRALVVNFRGVTRGIEASNLVRL